MQRKLTSGPLLNDKGELIEAGYATSLLKDYDRKSITASKSRIKEWDYYYVGDDEKGIALTIADNSYMGLVSISILDFKMKNHITKTKMAFFTNGSYALPNSSVDGNVVVSGKEYSLAFINSNGRRNLICQFENFDGDFPLKLDVTLTELIPHSLVIATPFAKKSNHFYYNQKINLLKGEGWFSIGNTTYEFDCDTMGVLDWGRGVWTYKNTWYWASMSGKVDGKLIGFNLGCGFGDNSAASENILYFDGEVYKLEDVAFELELKGSKPNYMANWHFVSRKKDINLVFEPILNRHSDTNALLIRSNQNQVFGYFSGTFKLEDKEITFERILGFAEKVYNRW